MLRSVWVLLIFLLFIGCHQGSDKEPFNRHAELVFTKHARCRMDCRHITATEIHEILENGNINYSKSEPNSHPDPKYAIEGYTAEQQHLRIIVAPEDSKLIIITCMELGAEWDCHCN
ncbi:MAG TPA: DUF4258 domain-containing protein [Puia sp.]|nr:DUF4258 domain-containing protein [Puia sp.]